MKVLLDECVPRPLRQMLSGHEVSTVQQTGWCGLANGDLLKKADGVFDVFITADKNLRYQQNLDGRKTAIIELPTPDWAVLQQMQSLLQSALSSIDSNHNYIEIPLPD